MQNMQNMRTVRFIVTAALVLLISHLPEVTFAEVKSVEMTQMVPTSFVVNELNRIQNKEKIQTFLDNSEVRQKLIDRGIKSDEISSRLSALSNVELNQLSVQIDKAQYGGDILFTILIVVLIIYLVKRI